MKNLHNEIFGTKNLMSGTQALLILTLLKIHNNSKVDYIGFQAMSYKIIHKVIGEKRTLTSQRDIIRHTKYHNFHLQFKMIDIINFF